MNAYIKDIEVYLPERVLTNDELCSNASNWEADKIFSKIGIKERHVSNNEETSFVLALKACQKLLNRNPQYRDEIDYVLYSTLNHEHFMMLSSVLLQHRLQLKMSCGTLDFRLPCTGFVQLLSIAKSLIVSGTANNVLIVTSDTYSKTISPSDIGTRSIFGDAATATMVSRNGWGQLGAISLGADGIGTENHIARVKCLRDYFPDKETILNDPFTNYSPDNFYMVGSEIFSFVTEKIPRFYTNFLSQNHLTIEKVDMHIFHQANLYMLKYLKKNLHISDDKFYVNMSDTGNTSTSSLPICLYRANKDRKLNGIISLCAFGGGYTWGSAIIHIQ